MEMMSRTQTFEWFSKFESGMTAVNDAEHSGCPCKRKTAGNVV
jgi:hypothetical protein